MHFTCTSWQYRLQGRFPRKMMQTYGIRAKTPVAGGGIIRFIYSSLVPAAITHSSRMQMCKSPYCSLKPTVIEKTLFPSLKRSGSGSTVLTAWRHFPTAGTRHPGTPSPQVPTQGPRLLFFWFLGKLVESMNGCGGGWAGGFGGGWLGGCRDTWAARRPGCCWSASPKAARCLVPAGLAWPLLLGQPRRCRRGFWDSLERKKLPSHLFLIISIFHNYPNDIDREACAIARGVWANLVFLGLPRKGRLCAAPGLPSTALLRGTDQPLLCSDT